MSEEMKSKIQGLIDKYNNLSESERNGFNEENTKNYFIRPLFEALGWDFVSGKEVTFEESIAGKRADYEFKINDIPKFYLEAKPIRADLEMEQYSRQAINYAWNKGVDWAVLTDFEGIKVYNAQSDSKKILDRLIFDIHYSDYVNRFDKLSLLSKESFLNNKLEEYAIDVGKKLKKMTVNEKLFADLKEAREKLTKAFGSWTDNKVDKETLDEGVQRILDRLVFIRVLEDKGLEKNILKETLNSWVSQGKKDQFFQLLISKFRELDDIYNSSLFKEHACEKWEEYDNKMWPQIINSLYGSEMFQYDFKEIPADILGGVYESYLGYIGQNPINVGYSKGKLFEIDDKSEIKMKSRKKRKEHGIYYTPKFIVDYIVKNTLGEKLKEIKTIDELKKLKVLDPACGSGSFITEALEEINEKYRDFGSPGDQVTKTTILLENIYGVDLDAQAVELARLNLLLRTLDTKAKLPTPEHIKNGNSLISGTEEELEKYFGDNWHEKKPFNWEEEYPEVFKQGGFDVIIGNPPYIKEFVNKAAFDGLHGSTYYQGKMDIWTLFACISIDLLKEGGLLGFIAPNNWITNAGASIFRNKILQQGELKTFIDFGDYKVFGDAGIQTMIFIFEKKKPNNKYKVDYLRINNKNVSESVIANKIFNEKQEIEIEPQKLIDSVISFNETESNSIFEKILNRKNFVLTEKEVGQGIVAAPDKYFLEKNIDYYNEEEKLFLKSFFTASGKYKTGRSENYIFYICEKNFSDKNIQDYPNIEKHFKPFQKILNEAKVKYGTPNKKYFYLHREREEKFFSDGPKVVCGVRVKYPSFYYTEEKYYGSRALNFIKTERINLKYLTGILNSRLIYFWLKNKGKQLGDLLQVDKGPLLDVPIFIGKSEQQEEIIKLVDKMLNLNKQLQEATEKTEKYDVLKAEIEKTDKLIDQKVYELYGLTEKEIKVVEGK